MLKTQDPDDDLYYTFQWESFLGESTIQESVWEVPVELVGAEQIILDQGKSTRIRLTGGENGERYLVRNAVVTSNGETKYAAFYLECRKVTG